MFSKRNKRRIHKAATHYVCTHHSKADNDFQAAMNIAAYKAFVAGCEYAYDKFINKDDTMVQEDKWSILKKKQAENIARLAKEHPDDWLFSGEMKKPEEQRVGFAPSNGKCYRCERNIAEGEKGITLEQLGNYIITSCPYCHCSFCD